MMPTEMNQDLFRMTREEHASFSLRMLYGKYGYSQYKMSKFEEYDLYVRNKNFLISDNIITFTDYTGRLLALKPDVTLSIVKNGRDVPGKVSRIYYDENVYRTAPGSHDFREINQVGLECIGELDTYLLSEVLTLAVKSLKRASRTIAGLRQAPDYLLEVSHLDIVSCMLDYLGISEEAKEEILVCIGEKNVHDIVRICEREGVANERIVALQTLVTTDGTPDEVLPVLAALAQENEMLREPVAELTRTLAALSLENQGKIRLDFSLLNDMTYYNGIVFRGYIKGIPDGVLSGGRYDRLMRKMNRTSDAIGFAVYLDRLAGYYTTASGEVYETVLLYDDQTDVRMLNEKMEELAQAPGQTAAVRELPDTWHVEQVIDMRGGDRA